MTMQNNIDIVGRNIRRDVHQAKFQSFSLEINDQRPVFVPVAISPDHRQRRTDLFQIKRDRRLANIAQMPDLIRAGREFADFLRQLVMRVGQNENFHPAKIPNTKPQIPGKLQCPMIKALPAGRAYFEFLDFEIWSLFGAWGLGFGALGALCALGNPVALPHVL